MRRAVSKRIVFPRDMSCLGDEIDMLSWLKRNVWLENLKACTGCLERHHKRRETLNVKIGQRNNIKDVPLTLRKSLKGCSYYSFNVL